jgi:hypothetical protein
MIKDFRWMTPQQWYNKYILYQEKNEKEADHLDYGSLVDTLMFTPELLKERFFIADENVKLPSDSVKNIIDTLYAEHVSVDETLLSIGAITSNHALANLSNEIIEIAQRPENNYGKGSYKPERIIKEINEKGGQYFELKLKIGNRIVISNTDNMMALTQKEMLQSHPRTKAYFIQQEGETLLFQFEAFIPYHSFDLPKPALIEAKTEEPTKLFKKGALDILRINHIEKTVRIVDFKTSFDAHNFLSSIKKYGYCTQLSYYYDLIEKWKFINYPGYEMLAPINIVIDKTQTEPYVYEYNLEDLAIEKTGYNNLKGVKEGWSSVLSTIIWHIENHVWSPKELYNNDKIAVKLYQWEYEATK